MPRCQRGGLPHARPKAMGVRQWGGRPAAGRQAAERGLARMCQHHGQHAAEARPQHLWREPCRFDGGSNRANRNSSRVPHDLCFTRNLYIKECVQHATLPRQSWELNYNSHGVARGSEGVIGHGTQVLDFGCQTRHAVILRQHGAAGAERGPGRSRPAQWSRIASGEEQWMSSYMRMQPPAL
jgi:hypothetical protein